MRGIVGGTLEAAQIDATIKTGMLLTDVEIRGARPSDKTYQLADVAGMYLEVSRVGAKYGRLKDRFIGKEKRLALCVQVHGARQVMRSAEGGAGRGERMLGGASLVARSIGELKSLGSLHVSCHRQQQRK